MLKILKFEIYKTIKNKFLMISFFVFFLLYMAVIVYSAYSYPLNGRPIEENNLAEEIESYKQQRAENKVFLDYINGEGDLPEGVLLVPGVDYQRRDECFDFLIQTNTRESDYLCSNQQGFTKEHRGSYVMVEVMRMLGYLLPMVAVMLAFFVLTGEYTGGTLKNLLATPVGRKTVFFGKVLYLGVLNCVICLLAVLFPMIAGAADTSAKFLLYGTNGYYVQSAFTYLFFPKVTSMLLSMLFYTALSAWLGQFAKKRAWGLLLPLLAYGAIQLVYWGIEWFYGVEIFMSPLFFMRYSALDFIVKVFAIFSKGWLWLLLAAIAVSVFVVFCTVMGAKKAAKQDC